MKVTTKLEPVIVNVTSYNAVTSNNTLCRPYTKRQEISRLLHLKTICDQETEFLVKD